MDPCMCPLQCLDSWRNCIAFKQTQIDVTTAVIRGHAYLASASRVVSISAYVNGSPTLRFNL